MNKNKLKTTHGLGQIAWMLPNPVWGSLQVGTQPVVHIYTVSNNSIYPVTISTVGLIQGDDSRLKITGGTCVAGMTLAPRASCTIEVEVNPRVLGTIKQVLCVNHSGESSPLWIDIIFAVIRERAIKRGASILADETNTMERQRRLNEQDGHRRLARVNAREHHENENTKLAAEGQMQNNILQNPWLNTQRFDGVDTNLNPEPALNSTAKSEFDNERREQEKEKQLRLGNMPKFSTAPKPRPN